MTSESICPICEGEALRTSSEAPWISVNCVDCGRFRVKGAPFDLASESRFLLSEHIRRIYSKGGQVDLHGSGHLGYIIDSYHFASVAAEWVGLGGTVRHSGGYDGASLLYVLESEEQMYSLRVYFPDSSENYIRSKYAWMRSLSAARIRVPEPLLLKDGDYLLNREKFEARKETHPQSQYCVIRTWLQGITFSELTDTSNRIELAFSLGQTVGKLVSNAKSFTCPSWFDRPRFDRIHLLSFLENHVDEDCQLVGDLRDLIDELGEDSESFGLIHSELGPQNVVLNGSDFGVIDFNRCGWGYYSASTYKAMSQALREDEFPMFLRGYEEVLPLPPKFAEWTNVLGRVMPVVGRLP